jgi:hypothetical protein
VLNPPRKGFRLWQTGDRVPGNRFGPTCAVVQGRAGRQGGVPDPDANEQVREVQRVS